MSGREKSASLTLLLWRLQSTTWSRKISPLLATMRMLLSVKVGATGLCGCFVISCFIGLSKLNITSGSRTYRIPSPTRALISRGSPFQPSPSPPSVDPLPVQVSSLDTDPTAEKGNLCTLFNATVVRSLQLNFCL